MNFLFQESIQHSGIQHWAIVALGHLTFEVLHSSFDIYGFKIASHSLCGALGPKQMPGLPWKTGVFDAVYVDPIIVAACHMPQLVFFQRYLDMRADVDKQHNCLISFAPRCASGEGQDSGVA